MGVDPEVLFAGERDETSWTASTGRGGGILSGKGDSGRSYSEQTRTRAVLDTGEIRGLPEGTMLMFYKGLDPMLVQMTAYYRRPDHRHLAAARAAVEQTIGAGRDKSGAIEHRDDSGVR